MTLHLPRMRFSVLGFAAVLAVGFAVPAEAAKARKHRHSGAASTGAYSGYRGGGLVQGSGPLYFAQEYLGTDPDPNIRFQLLRDISGRYGGAGD